MIKTLFVSAKCNDMCHVLLKDTSGNVVFEKDGYVPSGLGIGDGDYIELRIDLDTGTILNWKRPDVDIDSLMES